MTSHDPLCLLQNPSWQEMGLPRPPSLQGPPAMTPRSENRISPLSDESVSSFKGEEKNLIARKPTNRIDVVRACP